MSLRDGEVTKFISELIEGGELNPKIETIKSILINFVLNNKNEHKSINDYDWSEFINLFKEHSINIEHIYRKMEKWKRDIYDGNVLIQGSDSNVFILEGNYILKIYDSLGVNSVSKYHKLHNLLADKVYTIEKKGELDGIKYNKVEFKLANLSNQHIYGTDEFSFSIVNKISSNYNKNSGLGFSIVDEFKNIIPI